jgi:7-cyano-7-deazaguanine synthase in queuosine biosynthesis
MKNTVILESGARRREEFVNDINIDFLKIQRAFRTPMDDLDIDLLTVISCAAFADREFKRAKNEWAREIRVIVPVFQFDLWNNARVHAALIDCLSFATGDVWCIEFSKRSAFAAPHPTLVSNITSGSEPSGVILYSGGVDSGATFFRWKQENPGRIHLPLGVESSSQIGKDIQDSLGLNRGINIGFLVQFPKLVRPEPTYRTRSLVFMAAGAVAARLGRLREVIVSENGQGSVGPSLVPFGDEHPYVNNSPLLGHRFREFIDTLWPSAGISFNYPNVWKTKATLLRECHSLGHSSDWTSYPSCSRAVRKSGRSPCGICGNCILRRVAVAASADLPVAKDLIYQWDESSKFQDFSATEKAIAAHAVMGMSALAKLSERDPDQVLPRNARALSEALGCGFDETHQKLRHLVNEHAKEWKNYVSQLSAESWIRKLDEVSE